MQRAIVKRGFCISPGRYAEVDQILTDEDIGKPLFREMLSRESLQAVPDPAPAAPDEEPRPKSKGSK